MFQVLEYAIKGFFPKTDRVRKKYTINIKDLFLFAPFEQNEKTAIKFFFVENIYSSVAQMPLDIITLI